jgi:predicted secreted hydrolase
MSRLHISRLHMRPVHGTASFAALALATTIACAPARDDHASGPAPLSPTGALSGGDAAGYARALAPRPFRFPQDHGPHPEFRSEWWYFTGHLVARTGGTERRFGYQLTVFRQALAPQTPGRASAWATRQVYLGHLAISDVDGGRFVAYERTAREGLALGGAQAAPLRVWVEDWQITARDETHLTLHAQALPDGRAATVPATLALEVDLAQGRGPVLQGNAGLSPKGPQPGNASYYYSFTRLPTRGHLALADQRFEVTGTTWVDREWSTSALGPELAGWDWLSLSLGDGRDVMVFRLRRRDGSAAPESRATVIAPDGSTRLYAPDGHRFTSTGRWTSPAGVPYPAAFHLEIPAAQINLEIKPLLADQELRLGFRYWEGAVEARGTGAVGPLTGRGYLELTGYEK